MPRRSAPVRHHRAALVPIDAPFSHADGADGRLAGVFAAGAKAVLFFQVDADGDIDGFRQLDGRRAQHVGRRHRPAAHVDPRLVLDVGARLMTQQPLAVLAGHLEHRAVGSHGRAAECDESATEDGNHCASHEIIVSPSV